MRELDVYPESISRPLPTDELLKELEESWDVKLPESYKEFLKKYNTARPAHYYYIVDDDGIDHVIDTFLGIVEDYSDVRACYDIEVVETQVGERLTANGELVGMDRVPIAALFAGDLLCLNLGNLDNYGSVCVWYHEESGELDPVVKIVAKDFDDFLNKLQYGD